MLLATENATSASAVRTAKDSETTLVHVAKAGDMDAHELTTTAWFVVSGLNCLAWSSGYKRI